MLSSTLSRLRCPACSASLRTEAPADAIGEIRSGQLGCEGCRARFPVLGGVAILVPDVGQYLLEHVKGIAQVVPDSEIPAEFLSDYLEAKAELAPEHIEEDLEAERVIALYAMNHYLSAGPASGAPWWLPESGEGSPLIDSLIRKHWDEGPFARIEEWVKKDARADETDTVELGCGVAGLYRRIRPYVRSYLGIDSSFAGVALGRHLMLGVPYGREIRVPGDLLQGPVSRKIEIPPAPAPDGKADLVVGDLTALPVERGAWKLSLALNAIDMLEEPALLPELQSDLLARGGVAIQSGPYIWHEIVARELRDRLPQGVRDSASAVEWLYEQSGFAIEEKLPHVPWLFFKHVRQLEIYSVHLFRARK